MKAESEKAHIIWFQDLYSEKFVSVLKTLGHQAWTSNLEMWKSHMISNIFHEAPLPKCIGVLVITVISIHLGFYRREAVATYNYLVWWRGRDYHSHFAKRKLNTQTSWVTHQDRTGRQPS